MQTSLKPINTYITIKMASTTLENIKHATQATLDALNAWDHDALVAVRTDDFIFQGLPHSLNLPPMNNEQYHDMWVNMMSKAFTNFKVWSPRLSFQIPMN